MRGLRSSKLKLEDFEDFLYDRVSKIQLTCKIRELDDVYGHPDFVEVQVTAPEKLQSMFNRRSWSLNLCPHEVLEKQLDTSMGLPSQFNRSVLPMPQLNIPDYLVKAVAHYVYDHMYDNGEAKSSYIIDETVWESFVGKCQERGVDANEEVKEAMLAVCGIT